jgi:Flp pilus assembly protein TadG
MALKKLISNEKGQSAVLAGIAIFMVIAMSALALDIGLVHIQSSREQTAADAAALAGCTLLPVSVGDASAQDNVKARVKEYAVKNGISSADAELAKIELGDVKTDKYTSVRVELTSKVGFGFARVLGITEADVTKAAKAAVQPTEVLNDVIPLGVEQEVLNSALLTATNPVFTIKESGGKGENGFFGPLDLDGDNGSGANLYEDRLANGYEGTIGIGDLLPIDYGAMTGPTNKAFEERYDACVHYPGQGGCTPDHYVSDCPRVVRLVVYTVTEWSNENDEKKVAEVKIESFASFILLPQQNGGEITCELVDITTQDGQSSPTAPDYGVYDIALVE